MQIFENCEEKVKSKRQVIIVLSLQEGQDLLAISQYYAEEHKRKSRAKDLAEKLHNTLPVF